MKVTQLQAKLWTFIIECGLEEDYTRTWLGRIKSRKTKRYLRIEVTPELAQLMSSAAGGLAVAVAGAGRRLAATRDSVRGALAQLETDRV